MAQSTNEISHAAPEREATGQPKKNERNEEALNQAAGYAATGKAERGGRSSRQPMAGKSAAQRADTDGLSSEMRRNTAIFGEANETASPPPATTVANTRLSKLVLAGLAGVVVGIFLASGR
jgi:hypothetical protein